MPDSDKVFAGSIPENYDRYIVPLIFQPYADDMARRIASRAPSNGFTKSSGVRSLPANIQNMAPSKAYLTIASTIPAAM